MNTLNEQINRMRRLTSQLENKALNESAIEEGGLKNLAAGVALGAASLMGGKANAQTADTTHTPITQQANVAGADAQRQGHKVDTLSAEELGKEILETFYNDRNQDAAIQTLNMQKITNQNIGDGIYTELFLRHTRNTGGAQFVQDLETHARNLMQIYQKNTKKGFLTQEGQALVAQQYATLGQHLQSNPHLKQLAEKYLQMGNNEIRYQDAAR